MAPRSSQGNTGRGVLIVADDAHRFNFLDRLMLLVRNLNQRQNVKVLLGTRPSGVTAST